MATFAAPIVEQAPKANGLYDRDFYSWAVEQSEAMRRRDLAAIDWDNVIEEIEALARAERKLLKTLCVRTMEHMLKIEHYREASDKTLKYWMREIGNFRKQMAEIIKENPGLKGHYRTIFAEAWENGRSDAVEGLAEYDQDNAEKAGKTAPKRSKAERERERALPGECPYLIEEIIAFDPRRDRKPRGDIWPPSVARVLNTRLGEDFPVRRERTPSRGGGRQR